MTKPCAYPGCTVQFTPTNNRQMYHDRRESWRLSNRKWNANHKEQRAAINRAYASTLTGFTTRYHLNRGYRLREMRERTEERLAALKREEQECLRIIQGSATRTK